MKSWLWTISQETGTQFFLLVEGSVVVLKDGKAGILTRHGFSCHLLCLHSGSGQLAGNARESTLLRGEGNVKCCCRGRNLYGHRARVYGVSAATCPHMSCGMQASSLSLLSLAVSLSLSLARCLSPSFTDGRCCSAYFRNVLDASIHCSPCAGA